MNDDRDNATKTLIREGLPRLAYRRISGRSPGIVFLGGFASDMTGTKAMALEDWAQKTGRAYLRFDYRGHGQSEGRFEDGTIGDWLADALAIFDVQTDGSQILVGSSMGGWIALLAALARPSQVAGLVGIAAAPDFTEKLMWQTMPAEQREQLMRDGVFHQPSEYGAPTPITRRLIEEGRNHLLLGGPIPSNGPVRLLHGQCDPDVPWQLSLETAAKLETPDVRTILIKDGDHRLSRPQDIALILRTIEDLAGEDLAG